MFFFSRGIEADRAAPGTRECGSRTHTTSWPVARRTTPHRQQVENHNVTTGVVLLSLHRVYRFHYFDLSRPNEGTG